VDAAALQARNMRYREGHGKAISPDGSESAAVIAVRSFGP